MPGKVAFVTGAAGFVGFHVSCRLLRDGISVVGFDNFNDYYDPSLKRDRVRELLNVLAQEKEKKQQKEKEEEDEKEEKKETNELFCDVIEGDLVNLPLLQRIFDTHKFEKVFHLAAQAGVRYSITNPHAYVQSNLVGFVNILECCRHHLPVEKAKKQKEEIKEEEEKQKQGQEEEIVEKKLDMTEEEEEKGKKEQQEEKPAEGIRHLIYASSSSVYGGNTKTPYAESDSVDHPMSMYAATKKANEVLAHSYSHLYNLPCTGLRFFTVYGPFGRPDMAVWSFTEKILAGKEIQLFDHGKPERDFTYIDDIVEGVVRVSDVPPSPSPSPATSAAYGSSSSSSSDLDPGRSWAPFRIMNIGGSHPHTVHEFVSLLESALEKKADKKLVDAQPGDVQKTEADTTRLTEIIKFVPQISLEEGLKRWAQWYKGYFKTEEEA